LSFFLNVESHEAILLSGNCFKETASTGQGQIPVSKNE
jgi:hypothetical protein